jgi:hypothetical protein
VSAILPLALLLIAGSAIAGLEIPDPDRCSPLDRELDRIGASPANLDVNPTYQYRYVYVLRDQYGNPISGFPASLVELDFSRCTEPSTRPLDRIPGDGPSNANGEMIWSVGLAFGGNDPCSIDVLAQGHVFHTIPGADPGGLRSTDITGDGVIALADLATWQSAFTGSIPPTPCLCDVGQPFDDICSLYDLVFWQQHFVAP